jgi:hypothetical protein
LRARFVDFADGATPKTTRASFQKLDFAKKLLLGRPTVAATPRRWHPAAGGAGFVILCLENPPHVGPFQMGDH